MFFGLLDWSWGQMVIYTLLATHFTIAGVTIFLHRCQAHRALELHPAIAHVFRLWLWLTTGMVTKAWAAIHRKHHASCETPNDPHSPQTLGLFTVLMQGTELYKREAKNQETLTRYGAGTPDDWMERNVYSKHSALGIWLLLITNTLLFGVPGITIWAIQMAWIPFFAAGIINGIGHFWGYRNFDCDDASTNISPWGILIGGEELHNNHHTYPSSAKLSVKWWEFDIGWLYIKLLSYVGLAKVKRVIPKVAIDNAKADIDAATIKDLIYNRYQVMAEYCNKVSRPIFDKFRTSIPDDYHHILPQIKQWLLAQNEISCTVPVNMTVLEGVVSEGDKSLKYIYQVQDLKCKLQQIWNATTASQKELIQQLQDWCHLAESSGLQPLVEFANYLKGYRCVL